MAWKVKMLSTPDLITEDTAGLVYQVPIISSGAYMARIHGMHSHGSYGWAGERTKLYYLPSFLHDDDYPYSHTANHKVCKSN